MEEHFFCYDHNNLSYARITLTTCQAFKSIFTSPSSAAEDALKDIDTQSITKHLKKSNNATRSNVALLVGLTTMTACSIAYTAVQVRAVCSLGHNFTD
jgi:hypothetical protein